MLRELRSVYIIPLDARHLLDDNAWRSWPGRGYVGSVPYSRRSIFSPLDARTRHVRMNDADSATLPCPSHRVRSPRRPGTAVTMRLSVPIIHAMAIPHPLPRYPRAT